MQRRRCVVLALALGAAALPAADGQEAPRFPAQASAITVDVVVLDERGQPIRGLTRDDFTLTEDGRPQVIVGFDAREPPPSARAPAAAPEHAASNERAGDGVGRVFALVVDDLGLTPAVLQQLQAAIARWLRDRALPQDEVTLVSTSGDVWWSDRIGYGRDDLLAVLARLKARRDPPSLLNGALSDQEAYRITMLERHGQGSELRAPTGDVPAMATGPDAPPAPSAFGRSTSVTERVAVRFLDANLCMLMRTGPYMRQCMSMAETAALAAYGAWTRRAEAVCRALERASRDFEGLPARKSILLFAEDLMRDRELDARFQRVIDAAQRGNTAVYFLGARGLAIPSFAGAESSVAPRAGDLAAMGTEDAVLAAAGGEQLADATGGLAITTANDLADGLERAAADGSAYYLLGYQPPQAPDGRWHRLEVKVSRPGARVRSRHGYMAGPPPAAGTAASAPPLVAGPSRAAIPMRLAAYVQGPDGAGSAHVLLAIEIDGARVRSDEAGRASLDLDVTAVARDRPSVWPLVQSLDLTLRPSERGGWWSLFRDVRLPPGVAQVRTRVRDRIGGASGSVAQRVTIPDVEGPYLSTPLLAERTQPAAVAGEPPRLVPTAVRRFPARGLLYCQFELFGYAGHNLPGVARVTGGHTLTADDGRVVEQGLPTPIATDGERVVRRIALPLARLAPGGYTLALDVEDRLSGHRLRAQEWFMVEAGEGTPGSSGVSP